MTGSARGPPAVTWAPAELGCSPAFGWKDYDLHESCGGQARFGVPDDVDGLQPSIDEEREPLPAPGASRDRCLYAYDFGDSWAHQIVLEETCAASRSGLRRGVPAPGTLRRPRIVAAPEATSACLLSLLIPQIRSTTRCGR